MTKNNNWPNKWLNKNHLPVSTFAKRVEIFLKDKKSKNILELGCGNGRDAEYFSKKGYNVIALDSSESLYQKDKLKKANVQFLKCDVKRMKLKLNSFDVVYAHLSLHYFDNATTTKVFDKIYKILKPSGFLFIKCKSINDPLFGKGEKIEEDFYNFGHSRHFFTKEYMNKKLKNFNIIKIQKTNSFKYPSKSSFIEAFAQKI